MENNNIGTYNNHVSNVVEANHSAKDTCSESSRIIYTEERHATLYEFEKNFFADYIAQTQCDLENIADRMGIKNDVTGSIKHFISLINDPKNISENAKYSVYNQLAHSLEKLCCLVDASHPLEVRAEIENMFQQLWLCTAGAITHISETCDTVAYFLSNDLIDDIDFTKKHMIQNTLREHMNARHRHMDISMEVHYGNAYKERFLGTEWDIGKPIDDMFIGYKIRNEVKLEFGNLKKKLIDDVNLINIIKIIGDNIYEKLKSIYSDYLVNKNPSGCYDEKAAKVMYACIDEYNKSASVVVSLHDWLLLDNDILIQPNANNIYFTIVETLHLKYPNKGYEVEYLVKNSDLHIKTMKGIYWLSDQRDGQRSWVDLAVLQKHKTKLSSNEELVSFAINHTPGDKIEELMDTTWFTKPSNFFYKVPNHHVFKALKVYINKGVIDKSHVDVEGRNILMLAVIFNEKEWVENLVKSGDVDINKEDNNGDTALIFSSYQDVSSGITELLLVHGANSQHINGKGDSALIIAAIRANFSTIKILLGHNVDVNISDAENESALTIAVKNKQINIVKFLLDNNADVNHGIKSSFTALFHAISNQDIPMIIYLLTVKALDISYKNSLGMTALMLSLYTENEEIITLIAERINEKSINNIPLANIDLLRAISSNDLEKVINLIREHNLIIDFEDDVGHAALLFANNKNYDDLLMFLLHIAQDKGLKGEEWGQKALEIFVKSDNCGGVMMLIQKNNSLLRSLFADGEDLLIMAIRLGHVFLASTMIKHYDFNLKHKDINGYSALHWAVIHSDFFLAEELLIRGSDVNSVDNHGETILMRAARIDDHIMFECLLLINGIELTAKLANRPNVLEVAVMEGRIKFVELICEHKPEFSFLENNIEQCLKIALRSKNIVMFDFLLTMKEFSVVYQKSDIRSYLRFAVLYKNTDMTILCLKQANNVSINKYKDRYADLLKSVFDKNIESVSDLIAENKSIVNFSHPVGDAALRLAVENKQLDMVKVLLLANGIDLDFAYEQFKNCLVIAVNKASFPDVEMSIGNIRRFSAEEVDLPS